MTPAERELFAARATEYLRGALLRATLDIPITAFDPVYVQDFLDKRAAEMRARLPEGWDFEWNEEDADRIGTVTGIYDERGALQWGARP